MITAVRLNNEEQEALRKKCIEINKLLIKGNMMPLKESELIHKILEKSIAYTQINNSGEVYIETD